MKLLSKAASFGAAFALVLLGYIFAQASIGFPPNTSFGLPDGNWLLGLAGGTNYTYQAGITAKASGTQATCTNLTPGIYFYEVDTVASTNDSVCVPFAIAGTQFLVRNAGASTMATFAQSGTNAATASTDTIDGNSNATSYTVSANAVAVFFAAKNGVWSALRAN